MSFLDIRFPTDISYGSAGGPSYNTSVVVVKSGREKRNINWNYPRIEFDVAYGIKEFSDLESLIAFFHIVQGKGYTFRFKDFSDFKSCSIENESSFDDQIIATGDGTTTEFQIYKSYSYESSVRQSRKVTKPISSSVSVGINGIEQESGWSVEDTTGIITFNSAPADGASISAGFLFDIEARFDTDSLSTNLEDYKAGSTEVPIIEVKENDT